MTMLSYVTIFQNISAAFFAILAILLMALILLQRGRGVGLAGAFGGAGGAATFGAKTGDILTWVTMVMFGIYVLMAIILNYVFVPSLPSLAPQTSLTSTGPESGATPAASAPGAVAPGAAAPVTPESSDPPATTPDPAPPASAPAQGWNFRGIERVPMGGLAIFGEERFVAGEVYRRDAEAAESRV